MRQFLTTLLGIVIVNTSGMSTTDLQAQQPTDRRPPRDAREFPRPDGPPRLPPFMEPFDTNRDGEISAEEIKNAAAVLRKLDRNRDGRITEDELPPPPEGRGFRGPGGGPGGPMRQERKLVKQFDKDGNGRLNLQERQAARKLLGSQQNGRGPGGRGFGPPGRRGRGGDHPPVSPGPAVSVSDVTPVLDAPLYDRKVLRTVFLEFEAQDWEAELAEFKDTDVEVPATVTVDGKRYDDVGVHFRGMSSFRHVSAGHKRSLNLSFDFVDRKQRLYGYKTLNLLNCMGDPSMMSTVLYSHLASPHMPVPKANFVKVVINGRSWGVYANVQQFNKEFVAEHYGSSKGARWKVSGNPQADGGLRYLGEDVAGYRQRFEIKSKDHPESWNALISLCRTIEQTPPDTLEQALEPILDIDGLLWFLAFDVALVNNDGYWTRASDYSIYRDRGGKFHILPHDMNEAMRGGHGPPGGGRRGRPGGFPGGRAGEFPPDRARPAAPRNDRPDREPDRANLPQRDFPPRGFRGRRGRGFLGRFPGPGGPGGPGGGHGGVDLEPLVSVDNPRMPLRSKVLAVPALRQRYLQRVRAIAERSLDWKTLGPIVAQCRLLIEKEVEADTRKLETFEAFQAATSNDTAADDRPGGPSLRSFVEQRRRFLLDHADLARLPREPVPPRSTKIGGKNPVSGKQPPLTNRSPVVINELMAANEKTVATPDGKFEDWIELFNRGNRPVDVSGFFLSDSRESLRKWSFPAGTVIPARGHLVIWADKNPRAGRGLHAGFKLSQGGEGVYLSDGKGLLDQIEFGPQDSEVSFGRFPDGTASWRSLTPSAGKTNQRSR